MIRRLSFMLLFVFVTASAWWAVSTLQFESTPIKNILKLRTGPNHYMEDFTATTMDDQGKPRMQLSAPHMAHYPNGDKTVLTKPNFTFHQRDKLKTWTVNADNGTVLQDGDEVLLEGNVFIQGRDQNNQDITISTRALRVLPNDDYAESKDPVHITQGKHVLDAVGVKLFLDKQLLLLVSNVRGVYVPES